MRDIDQKCRSISSLLVQWERDLHASKTRHPTAHKPKQRAA